jgi:hypothetical protein
VGALSEIFYVEETRRIPHAGPNPQLCILHLLQSRAIVRTAASLGRPLDMIQVLAVLVSISRFLLCCNAHQSKAKESLTSIKQRRATVSQGVSSRLTRAYAALSAFIRSPSYANEERPVFLIESTNASASWLMSVISLVDMALEGD